MIIARELVDELKKIKTLILPINRMIIIPEKYTLTIMV